MIFWKVDYHIPSFIPTTDDKRPFAHQFKRYCVKCGSIQFEQHMLNLSPIRVRDICCICSAYSYLRFHSHCLPPTMVGYPMMRHFRNRHQKISPVRQVQQLQPRYEVSRGYRSHMAVDLLTSNRCLLFYRKGHEIRLIGSTHQLLHERVQLYSNPECYFPEIGGKPVSAVRQEPEPNRKPVQGNVNALAKVPQTSLHEREQNSTEGDHASGVSGRARSMCLSHTRFPSIAAFARQHPFLWLAPLHPHGKRPQVSAIH